MERFYILTGRGAPVFIADTNGEPAAFESADEARDCAEHQILCKAHGYVIVVWSEEGFVDVDDKL